MEAQRFNDEDSASTVTYLNRLRFQSVLLARNLRVLGGHFAVFALVFTVSMQRLKGVAIIPASLVLLFGFPVSLA